MHRLLSRTSLDTGLLLVGTALMSVLPSIAWFVWARTTDGDGSIWSAATIFCVAGLTSKACEVASLPTRLGLINSAIEDPGQRAFILSMGNATGALTACLILVTYALWTGGWPDSKMDVENMIAIGTVFGLLGTSLFWFASKGQSAK